MPTTKRNTETVAQLVGYNLSGYRYKNHGISSHGNSHSYIAIALLLHYSGDYVTHSL